MNAPEAGDLRNRLSDLVGRVPTDGSECPTDDRIWDAQHGEVPRDERLAIIEHVASCPECARTWRIAKDIGRHELAPVQTGDARSGALRSTESPLPGGTRWAAIAATLFVLVLSGTIWLNQRTPEFRAPGEVEIQSLLPAEIPLSREHAVLRWESIEDATYRIVVSTETLDLLLERDDLTSTELRLSETLLERIGPGGKILWRIEATTAGGTVVRSQTFVQVLE